VDLLGRAVEETGLDDFGDPSFREGLDRFLDALGPLTDVGAAVSQGQVLALLKTRLAVQAWANDHPELADERVEAPVFLVGISRSGTTALSHLLARDPANRSLLAWEANAPVPPSTPATRATDPRALAARDAGPSLMDRLSPGFSAIHHDPWDLPVECLVVLSQHFLSLSLATQYHVPDYTRWCFDADHRGVYAWHDLVLRILQSGGVRGRWQLKSPHHALALDAIVERHPDARFVVTHRDPFECVSSVASLGAALSGPFCADVPPHELGSLWTEVLATMADRTMAARDRLGEARFVDVPYRDVKHDPIGAVRRIYAALGEEVTAEADAALRAHAAVAVPGRHGRHEYDPADFGLARAAVDDRFAAYRERYADLL
jgi:hypothetical protein